jgi:hypothetical protein
MFFVQSMNIIQNFLFSMIYKLYETDSDKLVMGKLVKSK